MKYRITEKSIVFEWETPDGEPWEKIVDYTIAPETGCFLPSRNEAPFKGLGVIGIKEAMGLKCCCNPAHEILSDVFNIFGKFPSEPTLLENVFGVPNQAAIIGKKLAEEEIKKRKEIIPTKEKNDVVNSNGDGRRKLSDGEIDMIRQSEMPVAKLAQIFKISRDYAYKLKKGMYRK